jgi:hypothetical protein
MAVYTVSITVNVPGVGARTFTQPNITAANPDDAMNQAKAMVIVDVIALQKTA